MPLRDHFHPPLINRGAWEALHGMWPALIVLDLVDRLPDGYVAEPGVHLGREVEIDVAALQGDEVLTAPVPPTDESGGVAVWSAAAPTLALRAALPEPDEYEVRVYDINRARQLVAAVEIVSPSNKDRPEHRRIFVDKCLALLREGVSVTIVDLVTSHHFNLYAELLSAAGRTDPAFGADPPPIYATACRWTRERRAGLLQAWAYPLAIGRPLPTLPLWLSENVAVSLELEATYERACRALRLP